MYVITSIAEKQLTGINAEKKITMKFLVIKLIELLYIISFSWKNTCYVGKVEIILSG